MLPPCWSFGCFHKEVLLSLNPQWHTQCCTGRLQLEPSAHALPVLHTPHADLRHEWRLLFSSEVGACVCLRRSMSDECPRVNGHACLCGRASAQLLPHAAY